MHRKPLTAILIAASILIAAAGTAATLGQFDPNGKPPTKGFVAVQAFKWLRDNAPEAIANCDKNTDQYSDLDQEGVSQFKKEAINCLASIGFFNDWPGLEVTTTTTAATAASRLSDDDIRQILIDESVASYSGSCPCPYNRASNGSRCGARSARNRPGGASPLCYGTDVTQEMIDRYRQQHGS